MPFCKWQTYARQNLVILRPHKALVRQHDQPGRHGNALVSAGLTRSLTTFMTSCAVKESSPEQYSPLQVRSVHRTSLLPVVPDK